MDLPQLRHYTTNDFQEWDQRDVLILQPKFQRRLVWQPKAKSYLIDTIVRGFPIPPVYIREALDPDRRKTVREVVDGQQRLHTILDFLDGQSVVLPSHNEEIGGKRFEDLPERIKTQFLSFPLMVVMLVNADDSDVFRTFERLNSYTLPLTAQEKLNAKYFGRFKQFVFKLGQTHLEFWRSNSILTDRNIVRMGEAELTSELVVAMLDGLQDKKKSLERFYRDYDDSFREAKRIRNEFEACILKINSIMAGEFRDTAFCKKALFYSLFCAVYDLLCGLPGSTTPRERVPHTSYPTVRRALHRLGDVLGVEAPTAAQAKFIEACARQTDNIGPRRIRHRFILEAIKSAL